MAQDKKLKGEQNKLSSLKFLHRFGWLTAPMLAALVWPNASQGLAMARRTLVGMLDAKLVLKRNLPEGLECFTLSASGARMLTEQTGIKASSGASLLLGNALHRACGNWYLIEKINLSLTVWTEHEIQSGHAPVHRVGGKVADGLVATEYGLLWVEVENAWKNRRERSKVVRQCSLARRLRGQGNGTRCAAQSHCRGRPQDNGQAGQRLYQRPYRGAFLHAALFALCKKLQALLEHR